MKYINKSIMVLMAASLLSASPAWANESADSPKPFIRDDSANFPKAYNQTLKNLAEIVPELKTIPLLQKMYYPLDFTSQPIVPYARWSIVYSELPKPEQIKDEVRVKLHANTGEVVGLARDILSWQSLEFPSDELAKETAVAFLKKIQGEKADQYRMRETVTRDAEVTTNAAGNDRIWSVKRVRFQQLVNGLPVIGQGEIIISVTAGGHVKDYSVNYAEQPMKAALPKPANQLSSEAAKQAFADNVHLSLVYNSGQPGSPANTETNAVLKYTPNALAIDAATGKPIEAVKPAEPQQGTVFHVNGKGVALAAKTDDDAAKLLKTFFAIDTGKMSYSFYRQYDPRTNRFEKKLMYMWLRPNTNEADGAELTVDDETGALKTFKSYMSGDTGEKVSEAAAREKAVRFVEEQLNAGVSDLAVTRLANPQAIDQYPNWLDAKKLADSFFYQKPPTFAYQFTVLHDELPVENETYTVGIDEFGRMTSFTRGRAGHGSLVPDKQGILSPEAAKKAYLDKLAVELAYVWPNYRGQYAPEPILAYVPKEQSENVYIDAFNGKTEQDLWSYE